MGEGFGCWGGFGGRRAAATEETADGVADGGSYCYTAEGGDEVLAWIGGGWMWRGLKGKLTQQYLPSVQTVPNHRSLVGQEVALAGHLLADGRRWSRSGFAVVLERELVARRLGGGAQRRRVHGMSEAL